MIIQQLVDIIFRYANEGRPKATARTLRKADVEQMVDLTLGNILRQRYYESKKLNEYGEADYSVVSPILGTLEFVLSSPNTIGMRRADMSAFDLYRLPNDMHITNMYPIGGTCGSDEVGSISLVKPGEENFYMDSEFGFFMFGVVKGRGINFYNLPLTTNSVGVEATFNLSTTDVSFDVGFEIANHILGVILKLPAFNNKVIDNAYSPPQIELRRNMQQQEAV